MNLRRHLVKSHAAAALALAIPMATNAAGLDAYLPESGLILGEVMVLGAAPELEQLSSKAQTAAAENQEWFLDYAKQHESTPGPLPYHPNLGVTQEEYARLVQLIEEGVSLQRVGAVTIQVDVGDAGATTFTADPADFPLHNISVYSDLGYAETAYGRLDNSSDINQQDPNAPTGRWSGVQWTHQEISGNSGWGVQLAIGKRTDHGDGLIYYDVKYLLGPEPHQYSFVILYPLR